MQTFLPYPDFAESASVLDRSRLGKQRVETMQILTALLEGRGWVNHPATLMWAGYERALLEYQKAICTEWVEVRRYADSCWEKSLDIFQRNVPTFSRGLRLPPWLGDEEFHLTYKSILIQKDPGYYRPLFPGVPDDLPQLWPVVI